MASGSKTVNFMSSSRGGGDSDDDGPRVDELLSSAALLPRTISFKKSAAAFSSSSAHAAAPSNAIKLQAQSPHANGGANGTAHRPATANGLPKSPAATASSSFPRPPSHAGNNKLGSPSAPGQLKAKQQQQQQNGAPRPSSASASLTVPVVHIKDPNQFRWPKKYLYPSTSVSALLNWNKFDKIGCGLSNLGNTVRDAASTGCSLLAGRWLADMALARRCFSRALSNCDVACLLFDMCACSAS